MIIWCTHFCIVVYLFCFPFFLYIISLVHRMCAPLAMANIFAATASESLAIMIIGTWSGRLTSDMAFVFVFFEFLYGYYNTAVLSVSSNKWRSMYSILNFPFIAMLFIWLSLYASYKEKKASIYDTFIKYLNVLKFIICIKSKLI